jgi:allene oxide cyclase
MPIAAAFALGLGVVAAAGAVALQATPVADDVSPALVVIERATTDTVVDLGPEGDSLGDTLAFANELFDATDREVVGRSQGSCVRVDVGAAWECTWTNLLPAGSIVVQGPFYDAADSVLAITGGTGAYAGASGQMRLRALEGGASYEFAFEVR